jgi:tetratricopeptide (TPR) repeat protein
MLLAAREVLPMNALLLVAALTAAEPAEHSHESHLQRLGSVTFQTSCSPQAHAIFIRGMTLLHSFEYPQAEAVFNEAAAADPACTIAQWGATMSLYHPLWAPPSKAELERATAAIAKAEAAPAKSERERDYVAAVAAFYRDSDKLDHKTRALAYNAAMAALHKKYPDDREAAIFYALSQVAAGTQDNDPNFSREKEAAAILNAVLKEEPDHPGIAHYLIHNFDYPPLAELAVPAARRYASIAPDSPHAQHMPSHIFTRLGMWEESIASNLKSEAASRALTKAEGFDGASPEQLHAMDYLAYAYLQTGQEKRAQAVLAELNAIQRVNQPIFTVAFAATAIPARIALENSRWKEAASLKLQDNVAKLVPLENFQWAEAHVHFARAVGAARSGDAALARAETTKLKAIEDALVVPPGTYDWRKQVSIERQIAEGWTAYAEGRKQEGLSIMRAAADLEDATEKHPVTPGAVLPAREQLGELLLELNQPAAALAEFEASLKRAPRRLVGLYDAAHAAKLAGDSAKASRYFADLVEVTKASDGSRAEVKEARTATAQIARR